MNPRPAPRAIAYPALQTQAVRAPAESLAPQPIPFTELEKLSPGILPGAVNATRPAAAGFEKLATDFVGEVAAKQAAAGETVNALLSGQNVSLHQTMISMEEASVSFQLMVEVRNKLLESYQELMRMQV